MRHPFPNLRTHSLSFFKMAHQLCCFCKETSYTCSPDDLLVGCVHTGCNVQVHSKCARLVTGTRNITHGPNDPVYCATHWVVVTAWNTKTTIELSHLVRARWDYYVANIKNARAAPAGVGYHMAFMGFVSNMPLPQVNVWTVAGGGFV